MTRGNGPIDPEDHIDIESVRHLVTTVNPREMGIYCQNQEQLFRMFLEHCSMTSNWWVINYDS